VARPIVFLSDFGLDDEFVGVCHGVIATASPDTRVIDLTHGIPPQSVRSGALALGRSVSYLPEDAVVLAVVDPGVGSQRRPLAVATVAGALLVGPDNGLLSLAWEQLGGANEAVAIEAAGVVRSPRSNTFHGRDVFAPAAAALSSGTALASLGPALDPASLAVVRLPEPEVADGEVRTEILDVDRYGNLELAADPDDLAAAGLQAARWLRTIRDGAGDDVRAARARTFSEVPPGGFGVIVDSWGRLALVVNGGSAAEALGAAVGETLRLVAGGD
jgi:hypothetical protein